MTLDVLTAVVVVNRDAPFIYEVVFAVNGRPLQDLLRGVDDPREWVGPPLDSVKAPSRHLVGGANEWGGDDSPPARRGKVAVLGCPCGDPECGGVFTRITVMSDVVTWSEMECFGRPDADFRLLPGFTFNCANYLATVGVMPVPSSADVSARHGTRVRCPGPRESTPDGGDRRDATKIVAILDGGPGDGQEHGVDGDQIVLRVTSPVDGSRHLYLSMLTERMLPDGRPAVTFRWRGRD